MGYVNSDRSIQTTLNQCLNSGNVETSEGYVSEENMIKHACWFYHNLIGYVLPQSGCVSLQQGMRVGNWNLINANKNLASSANVFKLGLTHDFNHRQYAYIVVPGIKSSAVLARYCSDESCRIE